MHYSCSNCQLSSLNLLLQKVTWILYSCRHINTKSEAARHAQHFIHATEHNSYCLSTHLFMFFLFKFVTCHRKTVSETYGSKVMSPLRNIFELGKLDMSFILLKRTGKILHPVCTTSTLASYPGDVLFLLFVRTFTHHVALPLVL